MFNIVNLALHIQKYSQSPCLGSTGCCAWPQWTHVRSGSGAELVRFLVVPDLARSILIGGVLHNLRKRNWGQTTVFVSNDQTYQKTVICPRFPDFLVPLAFWGIITALAAVALHEYRFRISLLPRGWESRRSGDRRDRIATSRTLPAPAARRAISIGAIKCIENYRGQTTFF